MTVSVAVGLKRMPPLLSPPFVLTPSGQKNADGLAKTIGVVVLKRQSAEREPEASANDAGFSRCLKFGHLVSEVFVDALGSLATVGDSPDDQ